LIFMFSAFGINSILYQRGLYPSETFTRVQKYGLTLLVTTDPELIKYLNNVDQLKVHPEKSFRKLSKMKSVQWSDRSATVTFLPLLEVSCSFDLLICTDKDLVVPEKWEESGPQFITNSEEVRLRSFTTTIHKVNSVVAYTIPVND
uniref:Mitotic arrest deficient 2 like 1 n=1 Tax=Bos taurus TaxID=9913 RepID=G3MX31_BOVIN